MIRKRFFFILLFVLVNSKFGIAQQPGLQFTLLENPNGKSLGNINDITQDRWGYMWFAGTGDKCIYRYDGNRMITFRHDSLNKNSLGMTNIEKIYADDSGKIWIGGEGLDQYNPATGIFIHYRHDKNDTSILGKASYVSNSLIDDEVMAILKDRKGRLWIGTNKGLDRFDEKTGKFTHYRNDPGNPKSLSNDCVNTIYEDRQGDIWVGTGWRWFGYHRGEGGLNRLNSDGSFTRYMNNPKNSKTLINNKVTAIFEDSRGVFWIGTMGFGLNIMDRAKGSFERLPYSKKNGDTLHGLPYMPEIVNNPVTFIRGDSTGSIWIGTRGYGINRYDTSTKTFIHFQSGNGIPDATAWCAYVSREGVLWTGTQDNVNLYYTDPSVKQISNISIGPMGNPSSCFIDEGNGNYWVGSDGAGLLHFNKENKLLHRYTTEITEILRNSNHTISSMLQYHEDSIFLGMMEGGIVLFNTRTNHFSNLRYDKTTIDSLANPVNSIVKDKDGYIWFTRWSGLVRYNPRDGSVKYYHPDANDTTTISSDRVSSVFLDSRGDLWVGTFRVSDEKGISYTALNRMDGKTGQFRHYLKGSIIKSTYEDSEGTIWTINSNGLSRLKKGEDIFTTFINNQTSLGDTYVLGIVEDDKKYLWINTSSAILRLNPERNKIFTYGSKFGIMTHSGSDAVRKLSNGKILFGNNQGFYSFYPEELNIKIPDININISSLFINNLPVPVGRSNALTKPLEEITTLTFKYNQNNIGFNFAADDYREPGAIKFFTKLENYDSVWREAKGDKSAFYFYVRPGDYIFRVKVVNGDGTEKEKAITIRINPPWWLTWWAFFVYGLLVLSAISIFYRFQKQRIIQKEKQKAQQFELEQAKEIERAYHELKSTQALLIQSEKMASLGELTAGIAHEIQNPLNFVNNFSDVNQELVDELNEENEKGNIIEVRNIAENIKDNEAKINFHGKRADAIVKNMLQHSRTNTGQLEPVDINALADEYLRLAYHGLRAKEKSFNALLKTEFDPAIGKVNIVSQDIGRLLLNLYSNAFYAVMEKQKTLGDAYTPTIIVSTKLELLNGSRKMMIKVGDNGMGIPQKVLDKIFQPFFTTKPTGQGTGLGLSLSYDIVKAHHGEIKVDTREGEYTSFIIQLPLT